MADYGMQFTNFGGEICIDSQFQQYTLQETDSEELPNDTGGVIEVSFTTAIDDAYPPIIGLRTDETSNFQVALKSMIISAGEYTGFNLYYYVNTPTTGQDVYWAMYAPIQSGEAVSSSYGANIYNADGTLTWSSDAQLMNIYGVYGPIDFAGYPAYGKDVNVYDLTNNYFFFVPFKGPSGHLYKLYTKSTSTDKLALVGTNDATVDVYLVEVGHRS